MRANLQIYVARLPAAEADARRITDRLTETLDPESAVCACAEIPGGDWQVEVHFVAPVVPASVRAAFALAAGRNRVKALQIVRSPSRDWIAAGLVGLPPVHAGRFVVHGAHARAAVPINRIGVEIEAALAFGTGHHGTTRGCLLALDALARKRKPHNILDLGTGSGVLAIAAAKQFRCRVLATDIDIRAVRATRANSTNNHVAALIEALHATGLNTPKLAGRHRFNLIFANILLSPLRRLAAPIAARLAPGSHLVLSGLLLADANAAITAYRAHGLALERRLNLEGWTTLIMVRKNKRTTRQTNSSASPRR